MRVHSKLARVRGWLLWFMKKYPQACAYCGAPVTDQLLTGDATDGFTLHHVNEDRGDNSLENLRFCCRSCHQKQHRSVVKPALLEVA